MGALKAAELGASVGLVERDAVGGACVNYSCVPTETLLSTVATYLDAQELSIFGVIEGTDTLAFGRATARAKTLVKQMVEGTAAALKMAGVTVHSGRGTFTNPSTIQVEGKTGDGKVSAESVVIATGSRWDVPEIGGISTDRIVTPDVVQRLTVAPASALVLDDGPGHVGFGIEYAYLLAAAGGTVSLVTGRDALFPSLDSVLRDVANQALSDSGVSVYEGASVSAEDGGVLRVSSVGTAATIEADVIVAGDPRRPATEGIGLGEAGVEFGEAGISVDPGCRTSVDGIFAVGDVTGLSMLSSTAAQMGEVAAINATGGTAATRLGGIPRLLHTTPEIGWVGIGEEAARDQGYSVAAGTFDLSFNARAVTLGARTGVVKVVAERQLGEILGVQVVGPGAAELLNLVALAMQAEVSVHDLASLTAWHPTLSEGLVQAARRAVRAFDSA